MSNHDTIWEDVSDALERAAANLPTTTEDTMTDLVQSAHDRHQTEVRMDFTTTTTTTLVQCGDCGGNYRHWTGNHLSCTRCGHVVDIVADITPNLDDGEGLTFVDSLLCTIVTTTEGTD